MGWLYGRIAFQRYGWTANVPYYPKRTFLEKRFFNKPPKSMHSSSEMTKRKPKLDGWRYEYKSNFLTLQPILTKLGVDIRLYASVHPWNFQHPGSYYVVGRQLLVRKTAKNGQNWAKISTSKLMRYHILQPTAPIFTCYTLLLSLYPFQV